MTDLVQIDPVKVTKAKKRAKVNYVNNKDFLAAMIKFKQEVAEADVNETDPPRVSRYIGECISQIANRLASKPNFSNYPFKEEMIGDGIENCLQYIYNFNSEKSNNPFAYFTQIIWCAYLRRIEKEKKYLYIKYKATEHMQTFGLVNAVQGGDSGYYPDLIKSSEGAEAYKDEFIKAFEANKRKKK